MYTEAALGTLAHPTTLQVWEGCVGVPVWLTCCGPIQISVFFKQCVHVVVVRPWKSSMRCMVECCLP